MGVRESIDIADDSRDSGRGGNKKELDGAAA